MSMSGYIPKGPSIGGSNTPPNMGSGGTRASKNITITLTKKRK